MTSTADTSTAPKGERPADAVRRPSEWESIDWRRAEAQVGRMQERISKAYGEGRTSLAKRLSYLLVNSFYAKALAVRRVAEQNKGKHTPGVDKELWQSPKAKMDAVNRLNKGRYRSKPLRRIYIPKKNGKLRPLSIPIMYDRAMQALYALALDPIQEATADPNSYGFRIGRSCQDAMGQIQLMMGSSRRPEWVLEGDIKGCFGAPATGCKHCQQWHGLRPLSVYPTSYLNWKRREDNSMTIKRRHLNSMYGYATRVEHRIWIRICILNPSFQPTPRDVFLHLGRIISRYVRRER